MHPKFIFIILPSSYISVIQWLSDKGLRPAAHHTTGLHKTNCLLDVISTSCILCSNPNVPSLIKDCTYHTHLCDTEAIGNRLEIYERLMPGFELRQALRSFSVVKHTTVTKSSKKRKKRKKKNPIVSGSVIGFKREPGVGCRFMVQWIIRFISHG